MVPMSEIEEKWYTRPVFAVTSIEKALQHYCDLLGFKQSWKYEEGESTIVTQVNRGEFELILTSNLDRVGAGRVFVSLNSEEMTTLKKEIAANRIAVEHIHWGYPAIRMRDQDGNEMIFPEESVD